MRYVKFIKGLVIDERPMLNPDEVRHHMIEPMPVPILEPGGAEEYLLTEQTVETMVCPIHELRGCDKEHPTYPPELYIAYSKDVQMLLKMPFDTYKREVEECRSHCEVLRHMLSDWRHAGLWERVKFLFGRRVN